MQLGSPPRLASMRPAHQAREVTPAPAARDRPRRFNEARASSAGSTAGPSPCRRPRRGFNEARASSAGSTGWTRPDARPSDCFNEARASSAGSMYAPGQGNFGPAASMRPAHQAREVSEGAICRDDFGRASMRPAHQAREVPTAATSRAGAGGGFNEARASSAGSS